MADATANLGKLTTIQLTQPIVGGEGELSSITLREPKAKDLLACGELQIIGRAEDGSVFTIERDEAVEAYARRLLVGQHPDLVLPQLGLADGMKLKDAIFAFFHTARLATLPAPPSSSSTPADGAA